MSETQFGIVSSQGVEWIFLVGFYCHFESLRIKKKSHTFTNIFKSFMWSCGIKMGKPNLSTNLNKSFIKGTVVILGVEK